MYSAVAKLLEVLFPSCDVADYQSLKDSVMSLSGNETVEETTTTAEVVENTLLPQVVWTNAAENNTTSYDKGETDTEIQVLQLCEPCVFYCMSCFSGGVV